MGTRLWFCCLLGTPLKTRGKSELEQTFLSAWAHVHGDRLPEREYRFSLLRRWRFDFAWPHAQVAVEIQGGMFKGRGHQRPRQYAADCEKFRAAQSLGWIVLPYTTLDIRNRLAEVVEEVWETLEAHSGKEP